MVHKLASQQSRIFGICCFLLRKMRDPKMRLWINHPKHQPFSTSHISGAALSPTHNRSQPTPSSHIMSSWSSGRSDDDPYGQNMDDFHQENHWLVVWNIFYFSIYIYYIGNNNPNWLSYFAEGFKPPTRPVFDTLSSGLEGTEELGPGVIFFIFPIGSQGATHTVSQPLVKQPSCRAREGCLRRGWGNNITNNVPCM